MRSLELLKLTVSIIVSGLLGLGWLTANEWLAIAGSILFIAAIVTDLAITTFREGEKQSPPPRIPFHVLYHSQRVTPNQNTPTVEPAGGAQTKKSYQDKLTEWINNSLGLAGLVALFIGMANEGDETVYLLFFVPGAIISGGIIVLYVAAGVLAQKITGVQLKFGYGGWYVPRLGERRRRRRPR